ncbi:hypothetical protein MRX96_054134 [Rhipicephalus microplus]
MASVPCDTFHRNIDDIKRSKDDSLVLACNNLCGTKWEGSVRIYAKLEDIPSLEKCVASVNTDFDCDRHCALESGPLHAGPRLRRCGDDTAGTGRAPPVGHRVLQAGPRQWRHLSGFVTRRAVAGLHRMGLCDQSVGHELHGVLQDICDSAL